MDRQDQSGVSTSYSTASASQYALNNNVQVNNNNDSKPPPTDPREVESIDQGNLDAIDLMTMGHSQALHRSFSIWSLLALAFSVLGTWSTFAQDLSSGLTNGGSITILWGLLLVTMCNLCIAVSLGELCSAMPTALGQAYYIHRLWPTTWGRFTSYMCAWINTFGWWTLTASQLAFMGEFLLSMKVMFNPDWEGVNYGWLNFVIYIGIVAASTIFNVVACKNEKTLPWFNNGVGIVFSALFIAYSLALLICVGTNNELDFQSGKFVFGKWINQTGWPNGVVWFTGLIQAAYGLTAFDSAIHLAEEIPNPRVNIPRIIWLSVLIGAITGALFMVVCLFCIQDIDSVLNSPVGNPFIQLLMDVMGVNGAAVCVALFEFNGLGQGFSIMTTGSRLTWSFARDGGFPFSGWLTHIDKRWKSPARALWAQGFLVALVGVLYLFAETVLEAILSVSTIALTISYAMPIVALLIVGRDKLPPGPFRLGKYGTFCNVVSIIYCCITTIFFFFPGSPNPSPGDMNWAIAVFGVMLIISLSFWFIKGKSTYLETDDAQLELIRAQQLEGAASARSSILIAKDVNDDEEIEVSSKLAKNL